MEKTHVAQKVKNGSNNHWNNASQGEGKHPRDGQNAAGGMRDSLRKPVISSDHKSKLICYNCNKPGHLRSQCTQKSIERSREVNLALGVRNEAPNKAERVKVAQKAQRTKQRGLTHNVLNSTSINGSQQLLRVK